ncbi:hypothetical protein BDR22DRAFT_895269 [Usnea florida]
MNSTDSSRGSDDHQSGNSDSAVPIATTPNEADGGNAVRAKILNNDQRGRKAGEMADHEMKYHDLDLLYEDLSKKIAREEEKSRELGSRNECLRVEIEDKIRIKDDAERRADTVANAGVQKRIDEVKIGLEQKNKVAEDKIKQDRDLVILSKKKIETELAEARSEVNLLEEQ